MKALERNVAGFWSAMLTRFPLVFSISLGLILKLNLLYTKRSGGNDPSVLLMSCCLSERTMIDRGSFITVVVARGVHQNDCNIAINFCGQINRFLRHSRLKEIIKLCFTILSPIFLSKYSLI